MSWRLASHCDTDAQSHFPLIVLRPQEILANKVPRIILWTCCDSLTIWQIVYKSVAHLPPNVISLHCSVPMNCSASTPFCDIFVAIMPTAGALNDLTAALLPALLHEHRLHHLLQNLFFGAPEVSLPGVVGFLFILYLSRS